MTPFHCNIRIMQRHGCHWMGNVTESVNEYFNQTLYAFSPSAGGIYDWFSSKPAQFRK